MRFPTSLLVVILFAFAATAEERFLIPSLVEVDGVNGSSFVSDLTVFNAGTDDVVVRGLPTLCPVPTCLILYELVAKPGVTHQAFGKEGRPGLIAKAPAGSDVRMGLRVRNPARANFSAGTELPVIRESTMRSGKIFLLDVPLTASIFRTRLRVYSFDQGPVRVTIIQQAQNVVLADFRLDLAYPRVVDPRAAEFYPAFAEMPDIPALALGYLRIEIEPIDPTQKVWAFTTTTNNATHEITVVTPQL